MPVALRPQLAEHGDDADFHPPPHQLLGRDRLAPHQVVVLGARVVGGLDDLHHPFRRDFDLAILDVPAADRTHVLQQPLGVELGGLLDEAEVVQGLTEGLGVVARGGVEGALLELDLLAVDLLGHPEVQEGDPAVRHQDVVAGMGVGVEVLQVEHRAEAAAEDDLAEAAALLVGELLDLLEADSLDQLGDQDPAPREAGHDFGHVDEGVLAVGAGEGALVLGLVLVVELLHHPLADLLGDRLGVEAGGQRAGQADDRAGVAKVGVERLGDPRVLDLDRDLAAVEQLGAMHLADRGGGEGLVLELGEDSESGSPSYSSSSTLSTFSQGIAGASVRSFASCSW